MTRDLNATLILVNGYMTEKEVEEAAHWENGLDADRESLKFLIGVGWAEMAGHKAAWITHMYGDKRRNWLAANKGKGKTDLVLKSYSDYFLRKPDGEFKDGLMG